MRLGMKQSRKKMKKNMKMSKFFICIVSQNDGELDGVIKNQIRDNEE